MHQDITDLLGALKINSLRDYAGTSRISITTGVWLLRLSPCRKSPPSALAQLNRLLLVRLRAMLLNPVLSRRPSISVPNTVLAGFGGSWSIILSPRIWEHKLIILRLRLLGALSLRKEPKHTSYS